MIRSARESETTMFTRDDGRTLKVVKGFRDQVLSAPRASVQPKPNWADGDYSAAADAKLQSWQKRLSEFSRWGVALEGARTLEVGCGAGIDCLLMGLQPVRRVVGIDLELPLFKNSEKGEQSRRLTHKVLENLDFERNIGEALDHLPVRFAIMDATQMAFRDHAFDFLWSRVAMKEIMTVDKALLEMARVVQPGSLMYHSIDPYFWLKGCYKTGLVDIPWAHARLSPEEFRRFVAETEGEVKAARRVQCLNTLNRLTLQQWREIFEAGPFEILEWIEESSPFAVRLLHEHPEVEETVLPGIRRRDLVCGQIRVVLCNKGLGRSMVH